MPSIARCAQLPEERPVLDELEHAILRDRRERCERVALPAAREVVERLQRVAPFTSDGFTGTRERTLDVLPHPGLERAGTVLVARDQPVERGRQNPVGATAEGTAHCRLRFHAAGMSIGAKRRANRHSPSSRTSSSS